MAIKTLILLSEVRSGSTYAAELIGYNCAATLGRELWNLALEPLQVLKPEMSAADALDVFATIPVDQHGLRVFGLKCGQLSKLLSIMREEHDFLANLFGPETAWLIVRRRDKIRQAISLNCAICKDLYHSYEDLPECDPCIGGHCGIQKALEMINISDIYLDIIKDRISKIQEFFYEEIIEDPRKFLNSFLAFAFDAGPIFGAETPVHPPKIRRNFTVQKQYFYETFPDFLLNSYF